MPRRAHPADLVSNNSLHFCGGEPAVPTIIVIANREGITVAWGFREDNFSLLPIGFARGEKEAHAFTYEMRQLFSKSFWLIPY